MHNIWCNTRYAYVLFIIKVQQTYALNTIFNRQKFLPQPIYSIHQLVFSAGIDTEKGYPYDARTETCHYRKADVGATDSGYVNIPSGDEQKLKEAVATVGPVSVAIDATQPSFFNYKSGKFRLLPVI